MQIFSAFRTPIIGFGVAADELQTRIAFDPETGPVMLKLDIPQPSAGEAAITPSDGAHRHSHRTQPVRPAHRVPERTGNRTPVTTKLTAVALATVMLGTVVTYAWGPSSVRALAIGLLVMLAGTACLTGVLVRSVLGLRRTTRGRRPGNPMSEG